MKRLTIALPDDLIENLDRCCCASGCSRSEQIQEALERMLHNCCCICGAPWAAGWMTSDKAWAFYVMPAYQSQIICKCCWNKIVDARDRGRFEAKHGRRMWRIDFRRNNPPHPDAQAAACSEGRE